MANNNEVKHIHITAICGTAMGALAAMLLKQGYKVTGSDQGVYPPMSTYLGSLGIEIMEGFKPENLDVNPDLVIVGNTVKRTNLEACEIMKRGIPYMHLPAAIAEFFIKDRHSIVVGGTHGKTTTTSLAAWVFEKAGKDPGFMVGGILKNFNSNSKVGNGNYFIIEGDEYDSAYFDKVPKFWHYKPQTAVLTSVEFDHGDIYKDLDHVKSAFEKFVSIIPQNGLLVACADYSNVLEVIEKAQCRVLTYGYNSDADVRICNLELNETGASFTLCRNGEENLTFNIPLWGAHNASNAAAVAIVALHHGIEPGIIQDGFNTFRGIKRRQEIIFEINNTIIIDDFAHHPTKVRETVKAVKARFKERKLICIYEPRTNTSRRNFFQEQYPESFPGADQVIVAGVYNSSQIAPDELMNPDKLANDIKTRGIDACHISQVDEIISFINQKIKGGEIILIMSNGGFGNIYKKLPSSLKNTLTVKN
ncbi:MAG: UDP-N-acetylmuramate--L-alanine ligase [Vulcanimicrobiota bacterium]